MNRVSMILVLAAASLATVEHCAAFHAPATLHIGGLQRRATAPQSLNTKMVGVSPRIATRTVLTKDIKTPDPIPEEGQQEALKLMQSGRLYRYNVGSAEESEVSLCEKAVADYTGHKYCIALNSCGSALALMLKAAGVQRDDKVLSNAFTFGAVPSAIEHAGGTAVYVESTSGYVMDVADLELKLKANPDCKYVLVSHMRGKVADMDAIAAACERHEAVLLEDCAHSLGVYWQGTHSGHAGKAAAISSQSYKMLNSGEGGFFLTDDDYMAAAVATMAGAYEGLSTKHITVPPLEAFKGLSNELPNYSLRMSALSAAVIRPQVKTLDERVSIYNARYHKLASALRKRLPGLITIPDVTPGVTMPVHDSLQFNLAPHITESQVAILVCTHMYICMYICIIYVYIYTHMYMYIYTHICICIYIHTYVYVYIYIYVCICIHAYMRVHFICTYIYVCLCICIYTYLYNYTLFDWLFKHKHAPLHTDA